jgi:phosphate-selective porin OprO/OprP
MGRSRGTGLRAAALLLALVAAQGSARADDAAVLERVEALEAELALLRRKLEVADEAAASRTPQPVVGAGSDGFFLRSPDQKYQLRLRGYTHFDARFFREEGPAGSGVDTFAFRRIRPILEGTLAGTVDFRIMPDFAGSQLVVQDAWATLRYLPEAQLQFGKFKGPIGLERLQSATALWFAERGFPTLLAPNRDVGVQLHGVFGENELAYQLAWTNGVNDVGSADTDGDDDKDLTARFFLHPLQRSRFAPLQGLGIGFATSYGQQRGTPPTFRGTGQGTLLGFATGVVQAGERVRYYPQGYWYWGPFGLLWEYAYSAGRLESAAGTVQADMENRAWQVAVGWVLTGENSSYRGVIPSSSFDPSGGTFGAVELVARYGGIEFDDDAHESGLVSATTPVSARGLGFGVNWYLNRFVKLQLDYERTRFGSFGAAAERHAEGVFLGRLQLSY